MKAMANQDTAVERIEARVQGDVSGQIAVGTHILQIGSVHGGIVNVAVPGKQPQPKARPVPIQLRPRPFPAILDRTEESGAAIRALESLQSVELFGEAGVGKTVLLRHLAHTIKSKHFQDGIIYREIRGDPPEDVLQMLWDDFFECDIPFKPTDSQLRSDLQTKKALIMLDAVDLSRADVERVTNIAATCTFLLGSPERHLWGDDTHAMHLVGLPAKDAEILAERELGRPLTADEASAIETITLALKGNPLRVLQEVAMARLNDRSLKSFAKDLQSPEKIATDVTAPLSDAQRRILSALAIFSGAPVQPITLSELLQIDDAETILEELEDRHLVRAIRGRYTLAGEVGPFMPKETTEERKRAVAYFAGWIDQQRDAKTILETLPILMRSLRWGVQFGMAWEVIRMAKSLEPTLVLSGRWESWANALRLAAQSAINAGDKAALGWVRHQNGTKALCDGNLPEARESLEQALQIREALRDKAGADVTRHNLNLIVPIVSPWKLWKVPASIAAIVCTFIAAMVFASKNPNLSYQSGSSVFMATPPSVPPRPSTATAALSSSAPSTATQPGHSTHAQRPSSAHIPPLIPPTVRQPSRVSPFLPPVVVAVPNKVPPIKVPPKRTPSKRPNDGWVPNPTSGGGSEGIPVPTGVRMPTIPKPNPPQEFPKNGQPSEGGSEGIPVPTGVRMPTIPKPNPPQNRLPTIPKRTTPQEFKETGESSGSLGTAQRVPKATQHAGNQKRGIERGTASPSPRGSDPISHEPQQAVHQLSPRQTTGRGQGTAGGAKRMGENAFPTAGPHLGMPPSSMRSVPGAPGYRSPYTRGPALGFPMRTSRRH
jgi:hypothetical protein